MIRKSIILLALLSIPFLGMSQEKYWIFFKDKGFSRPEKSLNIEKEKATFSERTLQRRAKTMSQDQLVDEDDLPLAKSYVNKLTQLGVEPIVQSRWLNAISAVLTEEQKATVQEFPFVKAIKHVAGYSQELPEQRDNTFLAKPQNYTFDYGPSLQQNEMMHVPEVHDLGLDGSGVIVGMLDTGYDYKFHEAFADMNVIAEYDFINNDDVTQNETDDNDASSQHNHGTYTLSALGGFKAGQLIGPAFGASFLLAKTEDVRSETQVEEDYWVAGIEWLERMGVDLVSSSLGYNDWYSYENMDGKTAVTTIAADKATQKGVVVVNSMGNEGNNSWYHMIAPADGFNVISAGAVYNTGELIGFSSRGPTYDGRIKPDVVAMGSGVYSVQPSTVDGYRETSGTSLSCPLVAGAATLVLQAHPYLAPFQVREALRETADRAQNPGNEYGWGLVNAYEAIFYHGLFFSPNPEIYFDEGGGHLVTTRIYSKNMLDADSLFLYYAGPNQDFSRVKLFSAGLENEYQGWIPPMTKGASIKFYFSAVDKISGERFHPYDAPAGYFNFLAQDPNFPPVEPPEEFRLYQNYPNPFALTTTIKYDIIVPTEVSITIYNVLGQQVRKLADSEFHPRNPFSYRKVWDGRNDSGELATSGLYFYRLKSGNFSTVKRMVFLRGKK